MMAKPYRKYRYYKQPFKCIVVREIYYLFAILLFYGYRQLLASLCPPKTFL